MNQDLRNKAKKIFKHGDLDKIADAASVSKVTVTNFISGRINSSSIAPYVQALYDLRLEEQNEGLKKLRELAKS